MKILILKPSSLGDVIQALPVLRLIKRHLPQSEIFWWIESNLAPLLEHDADLSGLVLFNRRRWAQPRNWARLFLTVQWARAQRFDWVIDLQCLARSAVFGWLANGQLTVGLDEPREGARGFYDIIVGRPSYHSHAVDWYLRVLDVLKVPIHWDFEWLPRQPETEKALRHKWPLGDSRWIVVQPGARWLNKRWPVDSFAELVRLSAKSMNGFQFAILGGAEDVALGATIAQAAPGRCLDLTGKLTLPEMLEWIRLCDVMVSNDTGPMHAAAAMGKPLVALFGPTEPTRTGPYGQLRNVLRQKLWCSPCMHPRCRNPRQLDCLHLLTPSVVFQHVQARLAEVRPNL